MMYPFNALGISKVAQNGMLDISCEPIDYKSRTE